MHFLDILGLFKLNLGQISFNPAENVFATQQLTFLAISIAFYHMEQPGVVAENFALSFSLNFLTIFVHTLYMYRRLHSADHPDLGIIGKIFSSCRS